MNGAVKESVSLSLPRTTSLRSFWPLAVALAVFAVVLCALIVSVRKNCGGHFGYPMDDTYIHMAMARSLSQHGVWGLTRYEFSSTSSSPLFTLLLAAVYLVTGPVEIAPLILDIVFATLLLFLLDYALAKGGVPGLPRTLLLLAVVFGMPLGPETIAGMEHPLHALLTLLFVYRAAQALVQPPLRGKRFAWLLALGALVVLARYEALALVFVAGALFALRKQWRAAISLVAAACTPVALFGFYSMAKGWFPVPNSIVAKASRPGKGAWPYVLHWAEQLREISPLVWLTAAAVALLVVYFLRRRPVWNESAIALILFIATLLLHMQFARIGWFYRYEAYLIVLGVYACAIGVQRLSPRQRIWSYALGIAILLACLERRSVESLWLTPYASRNIYEQQYQMGRFLARYFPGTTVLISDIGAAGFLSDSRIIDLYGLSTIEVARAKVHHAYNEEFRKQLAKSANAQIAILYPAQYTDSGGLPPEWTPVGTWTIRENQICWSDTVHFYAVNPASRERLIAALQSFGPQLPSDVIQAGPYLNRLQ